MSIQQTSNNVDQSRPVHNPRDYAMALHSLGFNVIPVHPTSKIAAIEWKDYQSKPMTLHQVASFDWFNKNIAAINGPNNLYLFDLDALMKQDLHFELLKHLGLDFEYKWSICTPGKGSGTHAWVRCEEKLPLLLAQKSVTYGKPLHHDGFDHLEFRAHSCYTLLPPSTHPEGNTYQWMNGSPLHTDDGHFAPEFIPVATVPAKLLEAAFLAIATPVQEEKETKIFDMTPTPEKQASVSEVTPKEISIPEKNTPKFDQWSERAFNQELEILQGTTKGKRNYQLNKSAFNLGQIIGAKQLDETQVTEQLTRMATFIGLKEGEIHATIKSGLESGKKKPRLPKQVFQANEPALILPKLKNFDEEKLLSFSADDQGNAEAVYYLYGERIAFNEALGWLFYSETHYVPSIQRINTLIVETLRLRMELAQKHERTQVALVSKVMAGRVTACRSLLENLAVIHEKEFDNEQDLINTANGIVDLRTKTLIPHSAEYRFTWCSPIRYIPNSSRALWIKYLQETLDSQEMINYLQTSLGYSITGHTSEECLFYIYGPPRSGKGTLSETMLALFPRPIAIEVDFNTFTAKREADTQNFDLAPLKASRIVFASESNKYQALNPAKIKQMTGGNEVHCAFKFKTPFTYRPQFSMWLSSNHEVNADADDDAQWGRIKVLPFLHSKQGSEDKTLKQRMQTSENLEGVLSWLIDGAYNWYQDQGRGLVTPETVKQITQQQRNAQDSVGEWLEECCEPKEDNWIEFSKVYASYKTWCEANGYTPRQKNSLSESISTHGFKTGIQRNIYTSSGQRTKAKGIQGLELLS